MRGAFRNLPKGELETAQAFGMRPYKVLFRIWLPRAVHSVLPALAGEFSMTLKATPLAATITVFEIYGVSNGIRQNPFFVYGPLLFVAAIYLFPTLLIAVTFRWIESRMPKHAMA